MIENKGEFDFRYSISKVNVGAFQGRHKPNLISSMVGQPKRARSRESISSTGGRASQMMKGGRRPEGSSLRSEVLTVTQRLTTGMFTLQPAFGSVQPGHVQNITVDFVGDQLGKFEDVRACVHIVYSNDRAVYIENSVSLNEPQHHKCN